MTTPVDEPPASHLDCGVKEVPSFGSASVVATETTAMAPEPYVAAGLAHPTAQPPPGAGQTARKALASDPRGRPRLAVVEKGDGVRADVPMVLAACTADATSGLDRPMVGP